KAPAPQDAALKTVRLCEASDTIVTGHDCNANHPETGRMKGVSTDLQQILQSIQREEAQVRQGGGPRAITRQHEKGRLTARERIDTLIDPGTVFFELGLWAAWNLYRDWGGAPAAGVVTGIGTVSGRRVMVIANDATVKAGAF